MSELIPKFVMLLLRNQQVPLYGHGRYTRRYIHAADAVNAINLVFHRGLAGEIYNIGTEDEVTNRTLCGMLHDIVWPEKPQKDLKAAIRATADRPYHDRGYRVDFSKLTKLGWIQEIAFEEGLRTTIQWYRTYGKDWWVNIEAALGSNISTGQLKSRAPIPFNKPLVIGKELEYLKDTYHSGAGMSGTWKSPFVSRCQNLIEKTAEDSQVYLTTSGTAALEFAAMLIDIQDGDEVIMPSYTYVSTMNAFVLRGATCVFVDLDRKTMNIDTSLIEAAITTKTRAIVPVHYSSLPCDMDKVMEIANKHNLFVIEDAACCLPSTYNGKTLGAIGHIGCFSFHATKPFTAGGQGGAILVNEPALFNRAELIYENGTDRRRFGRGEVKSYTVQDIGSNFQMSETAAASLWAQLECVDKVAKRRAEIWHTYEAQLKPLAETGRLELPVLPESTTSHNGGQYWLICVDEDQRRRFIAYMRDQAIEAQFHFQPLHLSPCGRRHGRYVGNESTSLTTDYSLRIVRLPIFYAMTDDEVARVVKGVRDFFSAEDIEDQQQPIKGGPTCLRQIEGAPLSKNHTNGKNGTHLKEESPKEGNEAPHINGHSEVNRNMNSDSKPQPLPFELTKLDQETLLLSDEEYVPDDWEAAKKIVGTFPFIVLSKI